MDTNSEKLIQALEKKFPNGGWKKYIRINTNENFIEFPDYRNVDSTVITEDKDLLESLNNQA
jgi:hypothetical protein